MIFTLIGDWARSGQCKKHACTSRGRLSDLVANSDGSISTFIALPVV